MKSLFLVAASLLVAHDVTAKCAMTALAAAVLTPPNAKLPADGGVLVGFDHEVDRDYSKPASHDDPSNQPTWKWSASVTRTSLAPGLSVYKPAAGTSITVKDAKGAALGTFARDTAKPVAAAGVPRVAKITITTVSSGRGLRQVATATSTDPIPNDAYAAIVYDDGKPISFGIVPHGDPKNRAFVPWQDPSRCAFNPTEMRAPSGTKITLAWVDQFGRVGKPSAPVKIEVVKSPKDPAVED